ncbi:TetR/AcrR family transcriptional regulator [Mycolicibacterium goodii]|uniref:TetR/AcrR family transcriptional regulator n=1 Tax=Mycolicibacterium goodii TaxID=134601 RepID=UPI001BDD3275|nr:TetR/AcrR family transcriptional regulator [Mycolicibacterium goodii]MBU8811744.1 TetR/AcrR family transcriptional regulator [Mycolicibacterium goodii]ULN50035.1 TetR/AcrR family transcriptional regulator [Mycolicibacterium goodii]
MTGTDAGTDADSTRERILAATAQVLGDNGMTKLSLSRVASQAGVSRPTLYRWFSSKQDLLDAFVAWERGAYEQAVAQATTALPASERLDAALRVIAEYQQSYPGLRMVDIEPEHVIRRLAQIMPLLRERLERLTTGPDSDVAAATAVRVAVSHYLVRSDDGDDFLPQLWHAVRERRRDPDRKPATHGYPGEG